MRSTHTRQTTGTDHRAGRQMSGRGHVFALATEMSKLRSELHRTSGGRVATTLAKTDELRVTLVLLTGGATLNPESTAGGASLLVLEGRVRVQTDGEQRELGAQELMVIGDNLREPISALEDAAFLLTVAWPVGAGATERKVD